MSVSVCGGDRIETEVDVVAVVCVLAICNHTHYLRTSRATLLEESRDAAISVRDILSLERR